jgi:hypothetical protein
MNSCRFHTNNHSKVLIILVMLLAGFVILKLLLQLLLHVRWLHSFEKMLF